MTSAQAAGFLPNRPPFVTTRSSSSSLAAKDQAVPTFQSFIKRTPPLLNQQKPLPPPPLMLRRASSSSPPRSRTPSATGMRRSSSIYSRTTSQRSEDGISWRSMDFADEPLPAMPTPLPLAYSASTPHLPERQSTPPLLEARTYNPLLATPSPSASRVSTPSSSPSDDRSSLPPSLLPMPKSDLRTVSLEKARAAAHAPGAVHLLPEELRAQTLGRSRSDEPLRMASIDVFSSSDLPAIEQPETLVDQEGRRRTLLSPKDALLSSSEYPFPVVDPGGGSHPPAFKDGTGPERSVSPLTAQQRKESNDKIVQAFGIGDIDEARGRRRQRGPRNADYAHYLPKKSNNQMSKGPSSGIETEAHKIAQDYPSLLTQQYRQSSSSPTYQSDDSVKFHMKLVPRPLFQTKPPAKFPGELDRNDSDKTGSTYHLSIHREESGSSKGSPSASSPASVPITLSLTTDFKQRRTSTSGTIPISASIHSDEPSRFRAQATIASKRIKAPRAKRKNDNNRVSAYYPHVASRKGKGTAKTTKPPANDSEIPPMPFLSSGNSPEFIVTSTLSLSPASLIENKTDNGISRARSGSSPKTTHQPFYERLTKYAFPATKPEQSEKKDYEHITIATVSSGSPHLFTGLLKPKPQNVHLGWSDAAKNTFDRMVSPGLPPRKSSPKSERNPLYTHVVLPARPLDETNTNLSDGLSPMRRKSSILQRFLGTWKENKAEKRREELRKIIKQATSECEWRYCAEEQ